MIPELTRELSKIKDGFLHFSTDIWSTRLGEGVMGIRVHFIQEVEDKSTWEYKSKTIGLKKFNNKHTAINIRNKFDETLRSIKLDSSKVNLCSKI